MAFFPANGSLAGFCWHICLHFPDWTKLFPILWLPHGGPPKLWFSFEKEWSHLGMADREGDHSFWGGLTNNLISFADGLRFVFMMIVIMTEWKSSYCNPNPKKGPSDAETGRKLNEERLRPVSKVAFTSARIAIRVLRVNKADETYTQRIPHSVAEHTNEIKSADLSNGARRFKYIDAGKSHPHCCLCTNIHGWPSTWILTYL